MRLKKLDLFGFKSFGDPTEFEFEPGLTAIVGPNGCGKSNVVDAVKWILGEQSARSLRGREMMDVIFNGSGSRKSLGFAEASLTFCDVPIQDGTTLPELMVTRRLYRSGVSEYMLNREGCRLRDIRDLFLDTGIGVQAYSIIEQGRIDAILTRSPQDRRIIFEEAAGVSRYKRKRIEAERKLERTEANLLRIGDRLGEVERRLRSLKSQATRARRYREMEARLRMLRVRHSLHAFDQLQAQIEAHAAQRRAREEEAESCRLVVEEREAAIAREEEGVREIDHQLEDLATAKNDVELQLTERTGDIKHGQRLIEEIEQATSADRAEMATLTERLGQDAVRQEQLQQELRQARDAQAEATAALERARGESQALAGSIQEERRQAAAVQRARAEFQASREELRRAVARQEAARQAHDEHQARLQREAHRLHEELGKLRGRREEQDQEVRRLAEVIGQMTDYYHGQEEVTRATEKELEQQSASLATASQGYHSALSRREMLQGLLRQEQEGRGGLGPILQAVAEGESATGGVCGLLADVVETTPELYAPVEIALGEAMETVVCRDRESATRVARYLGLRQAGPARTLGARELESPAPRPEAAQALLEPGVEGPLMEHISVGSFDRDGGVLREGTFAEQADGRYLVGDDGRFEACRALRPPESRDLARRVVDRYLGDVLLVEDLQRGSTLARRYPALRFVTRRGELATAAHLGVWGDTSEEESPAVHGGLVARHNELRRLELQVEEHRAELQRCTAEREEMTLRLAEQEAELQRLRGEIYDANIERTEKRSANRHVEQALAATRRSLEEVEQQLSEVGQRRSRVESRLEAIALEARAVEREITGATERLAFLEEEASRQEARREAIVVEMGQLDVTRARGLEKITALTDSLEGLEATVQERQQRLARLRAGVAGSQERIEAAQRSIREAEERLQQLTREREKLEQRISEVSELRARARSGIEALGRELREVRRQLAAIEEVVGQLRLQENEAQVQAAALADRVQDEYELDLRSMRERLEEARRQLDLGPPPAPPPEGTEPTTDGCIPGEFNWMLLGQVDWEQVDTEVAELRRRMGNLGNVNLEAIEECQVEQERYEEMAVQRDDLVKARQQLESLIEDLNTRSRELFLETLASVRENFKLLFRKLFGGGNADIILGEGDPLEAGIEIMAKPPGKEPTSISLLSGGEKSMTAVALLFAIYRSRPSPFCILDEVDAALDEANISRFVGLLREFLEDSQFIIITHNKRTMSVADAIHGVTMQESGVSKRISVKFEEVA